MPGSSSSTRCASAAISSGFGVITDVPVGVPVGVLVGVPVGVIVGWLVAVGIGVCVSAGRVAVGGTVGATVGTLIVGKDALDVAVVGGISTVGGCNGRAITVPDGVGDDGGDCSWEDVDDDAAGLSFPATPDDGTVVGGACGTSVGIVVGDATCCVAVGIVVGGVVGCVAGTV